VNVTKNDRQILNLDSYPSSACNEGPIAKDSKPTILVIDDETALRHILRQALEDEGFTVIEARDKDSARQHVDTDSIDLITLDLTLGRENGLELARELRTKRNIPIIMITGRDAPLDRVTGLEHGADDYITKPFLIREVILRIQNVLGRYRNLPNDHHQSTNSNEHRRYSFEGCILDTKKRELRSNSGAVIDLTDIEFRLLSILIENPNRVLSRDEICSALNGRDWSPLDRTIDGHIARLRRKVEAPADEPRMIRSVRGVGYFFAGDVSPT